MRCQCCRKNPATIRIYDVEDWRTKGLHMICDACAKLVVPQYLMQGDALPEGEDAITRAQSMLEIESELPNLFNEDADDEASVTLDEVLDMEPGPCPQCGWTFDNLKARGRLGCPECYNTFREPLDQILERIHATVDVAHTGRTPGEVAPDSHMLRQERVRELKRELDLAVSTEDYERAAEIRDQIGSLEAEASEQSKS